MKTMNVPGSFNALLLLDDGQLFFGFGAGSQGKTIGEICFNTSMTGYQEIMTDPSYLGQIITFTFPHIGNTGVNNEDIESRAIFASGCILRNSITESSNFRANTNFQAWLKEHNITAISGIDTRKLTRHIRLNGAQNVLIVYDDNLANLDLDSLKQELRQARNMTDLDLAIEATTKNKYSTSEALWKLGSGYTINKNKGFKVIAIDFGIKSNILRCLNEFGAEIVVLPGTASFEEIASHNPDGVFLSNGPGDPSATGKYAAEVIRKIIDSGIPIFGICLGHQIMGLAMGAKTEKLFQGHRGANHPVKNLLNGQVEITSQNHGFAVVEEDLPDELEITHISLFDGTIEGLRVKNKPAFCVQYHPESSPGPHDSRYLFKEFFSLMAHHKSRIKEVQNA